MKMETKFKIFQVVKTPIRFLVGWWVEILLIVAIGVIVILYKTH